jgi:hypothetical protein
LDIRSASDAPANDPPSSVTKVKVTLNVALNVIRCVRFPDVVTGAPRENRSIETQYGRGYRQWLAITELTLPRL